MTQLHSSIIQWYKEAGGRATEAAAVDRTNEEMQELLDSVKLTGRACAVEIADVYICLVVLAHICGFDLEEAAKSKHAINQQRTWFVDSKGTITLRRRNDPPPNRPPRLRHSHELYRVEDA